MKKEKVSNIVVDETCLTTLKNKYLAVSEKEFNNFINPKLDFYRSKDKEGLEKYGFVNGKKYEYYDKIKEFVLFVNLDYKAPEIKEIITPKKVEVTEEVIDYYDENEPQGWAKSISINKLAKRNNITICPCCNKPLLFYERLGKWKCEDCGIHGGIKDLVKMMISLNKK